MAQESRFNFTKAALQALPPAAPGGRSYFHDTAVGGLLVAVTARGAKSFQFYRRVNGRPERITLGRFDEKGLTIEQARKAARELATTIAAGRNPADERRAKRAEMTLGELFKEYAERQASVNRRLDKARQTFRLYLAHWEHRRLSEISHDAVSRWHKTLPAKLVRQAEERRREREGRAEAAARDRAGHAGRAPRVMLTSKFAAPDGKVTANIALKLLHTLYNKAATEWRIYEGDNPAHGIQKFPEQSRERFLQGDELPRFFRAVLEEPNVDMRDFVLLALLTGQRKSNVLAMRWDEINLTESRWCIPHGKTKAGEPINVPLMPDALRILKGREPARAPDAEDSSPFVFPGPGRQGHMMEPKRAWQRILERAGIADLRMHDLRRSMGSWQAATGASLTIIGKSLGHRNAASTAVYARLNLDPVRASMERATAAMLEAGGGIVLPLRKTRQA